MTRIEKLLSISSEALGPRPLGFPELLQGFALGLDLSHLLEQRNGFYAFESALHVRPFSGGTGRGLEEWNRESLWRNAYGGLSDGLLFFGEDIFQDQFCLSSDSEGIFRFHSETGEKAFVAGTIEEWVGVILLNYKTETGWPLAHEWQQKNGPLARGTRLMPKTPFFLGGEYKIENLWAGDALEGMRLKADLATQTRGFPKGARVKLKAAPKPECPTCGGEVNLRGAGGANNSKASVRPAPLPPFPFIQPQFIQSLNHSFSKTC